MKISVVIPFRDSQETIHTCLSALLEQSFRPHEVVLVDNGSSDKSAEIVHIFQKTHPHMNVVRMEELKPGPSAARNKGFRMVTGDIIAFTDSDCVPGKNWLEEINHAFSGVEFGAVAGRVAGYGSESTLDKFHSLFTMKGFTQDQTFEEFTLLRGGFPTANLAVRKDVLDSIEGFDESMKIYSEDYDLCARIYQAGFAIKYIRDAVVYHNHRNSLEGTWRQSFGFGTGHPVLLKKHFTHIAIIELPKFSFLTKKVPCRLWLDLAAPDKKLFGLILLSFFWWPFSALMLFYFLFLYFKMGPRLLHNGLKADFIEKWQLVFLLFFKSLAMSTGRLLGSFRHRVLCF